MRVLSLLLALFCICSGNPAPHFKLPESKLLSVAYPHFNPDSKLWIERSSNNHPTPPRRGCRGVDANPLPSASPADAVVQYDVELITLIRANYWQKLLKSVLPLVGMAMVPALLGLIGYHLYKKASRPKVSKKKLKEEKRSKSKKK